MIAEYYGKTYNLQTLRDLTQINRDGVNMLGITRAAEKIGFQTIAARVKFGAFQDKDNLPCIAYWDQEHFVVVISAGKRSILVADPSGGITRYSHKEFCTHWSDVANEEGIALFLAPGKEFYEINDEPLQKTGFSSVFRYVKNYRKLIFHLLIAVFFGICLQITFPFLAKSIIDVGIRNNDLNFIYLILFGQFFIFIGRTAIDFIRAWILLYITARVNISILSSFFSKLMKLPLRFFDTKLTGDLLERISDQERVETFLTNAIINVSFSLISLLVFSMVLFSYNLTIFFIFLIGSIIYFFWVFLFMDKRRQLDFRRFEIAAKNKSKVIQIIQGMQEIKLNNCEVNKRFEWERLQVSLFKWNLKSLILQQYQQGGSFFITEAKNILITFLSAKLVLDNSITLGQMLAIQYIIGQLNSPIEQLTNFLRTSQDARISLERLDEIQQNAEEDFDKQEKDNINETIESNDLTLENVTFSYPGAGNTLVLNDITLNIPRSKVTAIVGMSGSGKTTLLKLLLNFYVPNSGQIKLGPVFLKDLPNSLWRRHCGVVLQDGYIFSDTIARNIAVAGEAYNEQKLADAIMVANLTDFIESLPLGIHTKIGMEGNGISQGQKQRILIARAVYKDPDYIFFDEATNALDAKNEREIMERFDRFFVNRTVVIVAHRLSTVKKADNIIVLEKGCKVEEGTHIELIEQQGIYFNLVKDQLELGE